MNNEQLLEIALRWMHIFAAVTAAGGTFFMRLALLPAVEALPDEQRKALHAAVRARWSKIVAAAIALLLISGLVNIMRIATTYDVGPIYHALFGIKVLAAFGLFFIASMLTGRSEAAARFQQRRRTWLTVAALLAVLVIGLSGVLKTMPRPLKAAPAAAMQPVAEIAHDAA